MCFAFVSSWREILKDDDTIINILKGEKNHEALNIIFNNHFNLLLFSAGKSSPGRYEKIGTKYNELFESRCFSESCVYG